MKHRPEEHHGQDATVFAERLCMLDMQVRFIQDNHPQSLLPGGTKESS